MNQEELVLQWLQAKKELNKTIAFDELVISNLQSVIRRLREAGYNVEKEPELRACKKTGRKMAHYFLEKGRF